MSEPAPAGDATARAALDELAVLRRRVRADRHALSAPLLVMGIIAAGGATFDLLSELAAERVHTSPGTVVSGWSATFWYWPLAVPAGFGLLALAEWWRWRRRGVGGGGRRFAVVTALAFVVAGLPFTWVLTLLLGPYVVIAGGLLAVGLWQRYRPLAVAGAVFGVLGVAEGLFWISNRLPTSVWRGWAHPAIFLAIAVAMVGTGLVALVREIRAAR